MAVPYAEVIGDPVAHSKSPAIHKFWLAALDLEGDYRATRVAPDGLEAYLAARRGDPDWRGCNVTMPLKRSILPLVKRRDVTVEAAGAMNLVMNLDGALVGYNKDLRGFAEPFREEFPDRGLAAIVGAGGAARAAYVALAELGFSIVHVANRTRANAEAMLRSIGQRADLARGLDDPLPAVDLLVNASAIGGRGAWCRCFDLDGLPPTAIVYDIVYDPLETPLLAAARARGLRTIDGLRMLIAQAAASYVHFFEGRPPRDRDAELRAMLTS